MTDNTNRTKTTIKHQGFMLLLVAGILVASSASFAGKQTASASREIAPSYSYHEITHGFNGGNTSRIFNSTDKNFSEKTNFRKDVHIRMDEIANTRWKKNTISSIEPIQSLEHGIAQHVATLSFDDPQMEATGGELALEEGLLFAILAMRGSQTAA